MKVQVSVWLFVCLLAGSLFGQTGKLGAPTSGFVYDQSAQALRRIQGIPGAAVIGAPVDFGMTVSAAYVSPHLDSAFVVGADGQAHLFVLTGVVLTGDAPREFALDSLSAPLRVVFSPSGSAAALYSPGSVQVVKGLPDAPAVAATMKLAVDPRPRRPLFDTLAIADDGAYLLYAAGGPMELIGVAGDSRQVMDGAVGMAAAFAPGGHDAAILHTGKLTLYQDLAGAATVRELGEIPAPGAIAFSPDSQKLYVASSAARSVTTIPVAGGDRSSLACNCAPTVLVPMGTLFRLTELGSEPVWLLDTASDRGLVFVPAPAGN